jgi:hypothetical protein
MTRAEADGGTYLAGDHWCASGLATNGGVRLCASDKAVLAFRRALPKSPGCLLGSGAFFMRAYAVARRGSRSAKRRTTNSR